MPYFDIALVVIISLFALAGLWFGFVHTLGSLAGMVVGIYLASRYYEAGANWLVGITGWGGNFPKVVIFIVVFFLINRLVGLAFWIVDKLLSIVTKLPFISGINRFLGFIFGMLEGAFGLGIILYFIARFPLGETFMGAFDASAIAPTLVNMASVLMPLAPEGLRMLQSVVEGII